jgi:hypothetical protein
LLQSIFIGTKPSDPCLAEGEALLVDSVDEPGLARGDGALLDLRSNEGALGTGEEFPLFEIRADVPASPPSDASDVSEVLLQSIFIGTKPSAPCLALGATLLIDSVDEPGLAVGDNAWLDLRSIVRALGMAPLSDPRFTVGEAPLVDSVDEQGLARGDGALLDLRSNDGALGTGEESPLSDVLVKKSTSPPSDARDVSEVLLQSIFIGTKPLLLDLPLLIGESPLPETLDERALLRPLLLRDGSCAFLVAPSSETFDIFANRGGWAAAEVGWAVTVGEVAELILLREDMMLLFPPGLTLRGK